MVGEIRDTETASLAVNAALTGHLVLSSLHTNSAAGTIARLIDMNIEPFLLTSTLSVIVAQRLIRRLADTKEKTNLTKEEIGALSKIVDLDRVMKVLKEEKIVDKNAKWEELSIYKPIPSGDSEDGYKSRIGIHEILKVSPAIKDLCPDEPEWRKSIEKAYSDHLAYGNYFNADDPQRVVDLADATMAYNAVVVQSFGEDKVKDHEFINMELTFESGNTGTICSLLECYRNEIWGIFNKLSDRNFELGIFEEDEEDEEEY